MDNNNKFYLSHGARQANTKELGQCVWLEILPAVIAEYHSELQREKFCLCLD